MPSPIYSPFLQTDILGQRDIVSVSAVVHPLATDPFGAPTRQKPRLAPLS